MENRINIAELLRECPEGMELDCVLFDDVVFDEIDDDEYCGCSIVIKTKEGETWNLTTTGCWDDSPSAKCVIFPKGKTTWEGFVPPFKFKDGDILFVEAAYDWIVIYKENENQDDLYKYVATPNYANHTYIVYDNNPLCYRKDATKIRLATEEEKTKLFKAIKDRGYKWNSKTKTLEILIEPKFKVGDKVRSKYTNSIYTISGITPTGYELTNGQTFTFNAEDCHELVTGKFDITALKPFDKVLVRNTNNGRWRGQFYMSYDKNEEYPFECTYNCWMQCIPFEGNEYLLDKTDNCNDFYKIW